MLPSCSWILAEATSTLINLFFIVFFLNLYYIFMNMMDEKVTSKEQEVKNNDQKVTSNEQKVQAQKHLRFVASFLFKKYPL